MKKLSTIFGFLLLASPWAVAERVSLSTPDNTFVVEVNKGQEPQFVYYGSKLSDADLAVLPAPTRANWSHIDLYPAYGATHIQSETAFAMRHADGNLSTQLLAEDWQIREVSEEAPNGQTRQGRQLTITLKDPVYPTTVRLH